MTISRQFGLGDDAHPIWALENKQKRRNSLLVFSQGLVVMSFGGKGLMDDALAGQILTAVGKKYAVSGTNLCTALFSLCYPVSLRWLHRSAETQWAAAAAMFDSGQGLTSTSCLRLICPPHIFEQLFQSVRHSRPCLPLSLCVSLSLYPPLSLSLSHSLTHTNRERETDLPLLHCSRL